MNTFYLFWKTGEKEVAKGENIADAFNKAGYSRGALGALDVYSSKDEFEWNPKTKNWETKK